MRLILGKKDILAAFEFKYNPKAKASIPVTFKNSYPDATFQLVTPENISDFLL